MKAIRKPLHPKFKKKLTIGIPTYNRPNYCKKRLIELSRLGFLGNREIEIIIHDNDSQDKSHCLKINKLKKTFKNLVFIESRPNCGMVRACEKIIKKSKGKWVRIFLGEKAERVLLSTGGGLSPALSSCKKKPYAGFSVFSLPLWGMHHKKIQESQAKKCVQVVTFEDHLQDGGFGSWFLEALGCRSSRKISVEIRSLDPKVSQMVASQHSLMKLGGLS